MLTPADKKAIGEIVANANKPIRDSVDLMRKKLDSVEFEAIMRDQKIRSIDAALFRLEENSKKILDMQTGYAGRIADVEQENKMGATTLRRHGINIEELAKATKTKISR